MRSAIREFVKFSAVGAAALAVDLAMLFIALHGLGLNLYTGRLFSYLVAATFTWACHRSFTFAQSPSDIAGVQWAKFIFFNAIGGTVNFSVYILIAVKLREAGTWSDQIASLLPYLGVFCGSASGLSFNFATSKFLVFR